MGFSPLFLPPSDGEKRNILNITNLLTSQLPRSMPALPTFCGAMIVILLFCIVMNVCLVAKGGFRRRALLALYSTRINCNLDRPKRD